jgi:predicted component of type VI protein secretion system
VTPALIVAGGPAAGLRVEVTRRLVVGRRDADVNLADPEVSRSHATVEPGPDGTLVVNDLGSTNGTWINGAAVGGPTALRPGDELVLGNSRLRVDLEPAAAGPQAAAPPPVGAPPPAAPLGPAAPDQPFGAFAPVPMPAKAPRRRRAATRLHAGLVITWAVIALDAIALVVYFAAR